jgi:hypothetical protein
MASRWLYAVDSNRPEFYLTGEVVYAHPSGEASFFLSNGWLYTRSGRPLYRIEGKWLYQHPEGSKAFYFAD